MVEVKDYSVKDCETKGMNYLTSYIIDIDEGEYICYTESPLKHYRFKVDI